MPRLPRLSLAAWVVAATVSTTGCADLPIVGNLGQKLRPFLPAFIQERFFAADDTTAASTPVPPLRRHRHPRKGTLPAATGNGASASPSVSQSQDPQAVFAQYLETNMAFDHLRNVGLQALYTSSAGGTARAIAAFKQALKLRPGDKNVIALLSLAEHPPVNVDSGNQLPMGTVPELVQPGQVTTGSAPSSPASAPNQGAAPEAPVVPPVETQIPVLPRARVPVPHG